MAAGGRRADDGLGAHLLGDEAAAVDVRSWLRSSDETIQMARKGRGDGVAPARRRRDEFEDA